MLTAFIIWSALAAVFVFMGIRMRRSQKPVGLWANAEAPKNIEDVKGFNRAVSNLWLTFTVLYEACGIPLLVCEQNSPGIFLCMLIVPVCIGTMIAYTLLELKYKSKKK